MRAIEKVVEHPATYVVLLILGLVWIAIGLPQMTPSAWLGVVAWGLGLLTLMAFRGRLRTREQPTETSKDSLSGPTQAIAVASGSIVGLVGVVFMGPAWAILGALVTAAVADLLPAAVRSKAVENVPTTGTPAWAQILLLSLVVGAGLGFFAYVRAA